MPTIQVETERRYLSRRAVEKDYMYFDNINGRWDYTDEIELAQRYCSAGSAAFEGQYEAVPVDYASAYIKEVKE